MSGLGWTRLFSLAMITGNPNAVSWLFFAEVLADILLFLVARPSLKWNRMDVDSMYVLRRL